MSDRFTEGVGEWRQQLDKMRNVVRQELVSRQLDNHLPAQEGGLRILDIGSGQGTQALRLARLGHQVVGVEPDDSLRAIAQDGAPENAAFYKGTLEAVPSEVGTRFDVVCCHGVFMYLDSLNDSAQQLLALAGPRGLVSVLTSNQASIAMRAGMTKDWATVVTSFEERYYRNRLGVSNVRADTPQEVIRAFTDSGATLVDWYGVRLFTDHWDNGAPPDNVSDIIDAEYAAGMRDPYRQLASLTHVIVQKES